MKYVIVSALILLACACKKTDFDPAADCRDQYNSKVKSLNDRYNKGVITQDVYTAQLEIAMDSYNECLKRAGSK